jgi:hypothetical protein
MDKVFFFLRKYAMLNGHCYSDSIFVPFGVSPLNRCACSSKQTEKQTEQQTKVQTGNGRSPRSARRIAAYPAARKRDIRLELRVPPSTASSVTWELHEQSKATRWSTVCGMKRVLLEVGRCGCCMIVGSDRDTWRWSLSHAARVSLRIRP